MKKTKIVCTLGPSTDDEDILKKIILNGMNVARINLSHSNKEEHLKRINTVKKIGNRLNIPIAIMLDTKGPEIRTGDFDNNFAELNYLDEVVVTSENILGNNKNISISYKKIGEKLTIGQEIFIDDGLVRLKIIEIIDENSVKCIVENAGIIKNKKGVNIPDLKSELPIITENDHDDIVFGIENDIDFIAVSFVRNSSDILEIRKIIEERNAGHIQIIAKIESRVGLNNIDEIMKVSDGIMIARGDLGVEIPAEEVPIVQRNLIEKCNSLSKPVITATQMLNSMINNPRPTRAEVSDVATAIFQGSDGIMLSGETAIGDFPVESVITMTKIAKRIEAELNYENMFNEREYSVEKSVTNVISMATCRTALELNSKAIICATSSGYTAKAVSKFRPKSVIIAATSSRKVMRKLSLVWGVYSVLIEDADTTDKVIEMSVEKALQEEIIKNGDLIVITAGIPVGVYGGTNIIKVHLVSEMISKSMGLGDTVTGKAYILKDINRALEEFEEGEILVLENSSKEMIPLFEKASAVISEEEGLTSNTFIMAMNLSKTVVVGVKDAASIIKKGEILTVNGNRGVIYRGETKTL